MWWRLTNTVFIIHSSSSPDGKTHEQTFTTLNQAQNWSFIETSTCANATAKLRTPLDLIELISFDNQLNRDIRIIQDKLIDAAK